MKTLVTGLCLVSTLILLASGISADEGGAWAGRSSMKIPRQEMGAARIGDHVYVAGGLTNAKPEVVTNTVEAYSISLDQWELVAPIPVPLHHMAVAAVGGLLYVMGGFDSDGDARSETWVYDPVGDQWSGAAPLPASRGACWAAEYDGRIYLFGGRLGQDTVASTFIYDPGSDQWTLGQDMPTARNHLIAVTVGDFIYVMGGRPPLVDVNERYDPFLDDWATLTPMPTGRSAMAAAAMGNKIYVAGGEVPLFSVNEVYDISSNSWSCAEEMPIPRHGLGAVALDDRILLPGGGIEQGFGPTNAVDSFVPEEACVGLELEVLRVNGATGTASIPIGSMIDVSFAASGSGPDPGLFALWVWRGVSSSRVELAAGGSVIGCPVNPTPLHGNLSPQPFRCMRSSQLPVAICGSIPEIMGPGMVPWTLQHAGFGQAIGFMIQGVVEDDGAANPFGFSVTNSVRVVVE